jgi:hypothetical protein
VRTLLAAMLVLFGCAAGRAYETDRFEVKLTDATQVSETRGLKGMEWSFSDGSGRQFLGASTYSIAGDPTFPCGVPAVERNGARGFVVRRTVGNWRSQPTVASILFPQEDGIVLDFSYEEANDAARALLAKVTVRQPPRDRAVPCEVVRTGGPLDGDTYDAGSFTAKLLPGTWLFDRGHFRSTNPDMGPWYFEDAASGRAFLEALAYHAELSGNCLEGSLIQINGATGYRKSDTDGLEPYPGPSNVTITFVKQPAEGRTLVLTFNYDEHGAMAALAEKTLQTVRIRDAAPVAPGCPRKR